MMEAKKGRERISKVKEKKSNEITPLSGRNINLKRTQPQLGDLDWTRHLFSNATPEVIKPEETE